MSLLTLLVGSAPKIDSTQESKVHMRIDFFAITIGTNLTTLASSGLEISCPASGFPTPVIQWYREGVPVQPGMMLNVDKDTGTLFTLSISHRKGGTFTCEASNALGSDSASSVVTVLGMVMLFMFETILREWDLCNSDNTVARVPKTMVSLCEFDLNENEFDWIWRTRKTSNASDFPKLALYR